MRIFLFILGVFAAVVCFEKPAAAQNSAWCAYLNFVGGATNCGFQTYQQCLAAVTGDAMAVAFSSQTSAFPYCTKITWHGNYYVCTIDEE